MEHWRYFLTLEEDLERTTRYVEPVSKNFKTFSMEFARLILTTCSEIDVIAKVICAAVAPNQKVGNMDDYRKIILEKYPKLPTLKILIPRFSLEMEPWKEWANTMNPGWWKEYQQVKHARHENFRLADLEHAVVSMAGLFVLLLYLYHQELFALRLIPKATLFAIETEPSSIVTGKYTLPDFA